MGDYETCTENGCNRRQRRGHELCGFHLYSPTNNRNESESVDGATVQPTCVDCGKRSGFHPVTGQPDERCKPCYVAAKTAPKPGERRDYLTAEQTAEMLAESRSIPRDLHAVERVGSLRALLKGNQ